jgi:hypothetical protein
MQHLQWRALAQGHLVVMEINYGATPALDTEEIYFDPTAGQPLSALVPSAIMNVSLEFNDFDFFQEINGLNMDNLRFGTSFADVAPGIVSVPEPVSITVLAPGLLLMLRRKRC